MRPDTEPNPHAQRIMAGAAILTVVGILIEVMLWIGENYAPLGTALLIVGFVTVACYAIGTLGLIMAPTSDEGGRP